MGGDLDPIERGGNKKYLPVGVVMSSENFKSPRGQPPSAAPNRAIAGADQLAVALAHVDLLQKINSENLTKDR